MYAGMRSAAAVLLAIVLVMIGLWLWQRGPDMLLDLGLDSPEMAMWSLRGAAIASVATAQAILVAGALGQVYRRSLFDTVIGAGAAVISVLAAGAAVACGMMAR